jgi:hypothetical protein
MTETKTTYILGKLDGLRTELVDLAYHLECRGRLDAADVAMTISARIGELWDEFTAARLASIPHEHPIPCSVSGLGRKSGFEQ